MTQKTNGDLMREHADRTNPGPGRSLEQVRKALAACKKQGSDVTMARMMLRFGRMTPEARTWVAKEYP